MSVSDNPKYRETVLRKCIEAARKFNYNPGHSDLDYESIEYLSVPIGLIRALRILDAADEVRKA